MSVNFNTKRNKWRLVLPVEGDLKAKRIEWFESEEEALAVRKKFFAEDPYGIHLTRLLHGTKAEQAAYRAELEASRRKIEEDERNGKISVQPTGIYTLQLDGVTILNVLTILTDGASAYRQHGFEGMGKHAEDARSKIVAALEDGLKGRLK